MSPLMMIFYLSLLIVSLVKANPCPNSQFKLVARYRGTFTLTSSVGGNDAKRYWIAFGRKGNWAIELVDTKYDGKSQVFKCKENYWGSVKPIKFDEEKKRKLGEQLRCCASPHFIDDISSDGNHGKTNPFAVLPNHWYHELQQDQNQMNMDWNKYHWIHSPANTGKDKAEFRKWNRIKLSDKGIWSDVPQEGWKVTKYEFEMLPIQQLVNIAQCYTADSTECETGITNDIVVFIVMCSPRDSPTPFYEYIRFGVSVDGLFDLNYLECPWKLVSSHADKARANYKRDIHYFSITKFFKMKKINRQQPGRPLQLQQPQLQHLIAQDPPSYNSFGLGWKLGSYCASCPSTSINMQISEKEAKMNKKRIQNSLSVSVEAGAGGFQGAPFGKGRLGYTRLWFKEAATTITSGRATTISAVCNGFYLWYWTVSVGTWGEGDAVIPTQLFYCSDRSTPPVCRPRIAGVNDNGQYGKLCNGHDVLADFDPNSNNANDEWQSMHSGRPKPLRLQGQKDGEPVFKTRAAAENDDYGDYMDIDMNIDMDDVNPAEKGMFMGHVTYDDVNEQEEVEDVMKKRDHHPHRKRYHNHDKFMYQQNNGVIHGGIMEAVLTLELITIVMCGIFFMCIGVLCGWMAGYLIKRNKLFN